MKKILSTIIIFLLTLHTFSNGLNLEKNYELVVSDLNNPWSFVFLSEKSMLITEKEGKLIHKEDIYHGIENFRETFLRLFSGEKMGKLILKI